jgi:hypothetical protein
LFSGELSIDEWREAGLRTGTHGRTRTILGFSFPCTPPSDRDERRIACGELYVNKKIHTYFILFFP